MDGPFYRPKAGAATACLRAQPPLSSIRWMPHSRFWSRSPRSVCLVMNQVEGGAIQSASWALRERVRFDRTRITSVTWESYPILRFTEVPEVAVRIVAAPGEPETGAGELAQGPVAGAIGNAVADAVGVRVRDLPLTTEQVTRAIEQS